jgi:hypothetical protein
MQTSQSAVARLESGQHDAQLSTVTRYAEALGVSLNFGEDTRPSAEAATDPQSCPDRSWSLRFRLAAVKVTLVVHLLLCRTRSGVTPVDVMSWPVARWLGEWWPGSARRHYVEIRLHRPQRTCSRPQRVARNPRRPRQTRRPAVRRRTKPGG